MKSKLTLALATALAAWLLVACGGQNTPQKQNQAPAARFTASPTSGVAPLKVTFDASGSSDPDGSIASYSWDFGDGSSGSGVKVEHTYQSAGNYTVRLTVTDNGGATASAQQTITVNKAGTTGTISGTVTAGLSGTALPNLEERGNWQLDDNLDFVPGELIVKFKSSLSTQALSALQVGSVQLMRVRSVPVASLQLYRATGIDKTRTLELARALNAREDVLYAHPNYILKPLAEPNDEFYRYQWHYPAINLPQAWDITTGAASTVVAIIDTGILFKDGDINRTHPDFNGKVLPGYDFISDPNIALDGDGRDPDPFDVGDNPDGQSSYHGSHVGGTVAAATNNSIGVSGVNWQARLLPVRVLGAGGGNMVDILEGALWAAGFDVSGVPQNPNPASIINMSLGGPGECYPAMQDVFNRILTRAIVVVAAGNENQNAANVSPASCSGVITVGATDFAGNRAPYSNYGSRIDVMAPGGDVSADLNGDGYSDGVLSTSFKDGSNGGFFYTFLNGTSMAAPHVAGVVSLMKALKPDLSAAEAVAVLRATARPLNATQCNRPSGSECGAGLIDAFAALKSLQSGTTPGAGQLSFEPDPLDFGADATKLTLKLTNVGDASVTWKIKGYEPAADNPGTLQQGAVYLPEGAVTSGTLAAGASATTSLGINRDKVTAEGFYQLALVFDVNGAEQRLTVRFSKSTNKPPSLSGPMVVAAFIEKDGKWVESGFQKSPGVINDYRFEAKPGINIVVAWSDENNNAKVDEGDYLGRYPEGVLVKANEETSGVDITVERVINANALTLSVESLRSLEQWRALE